MPTTGPIERALAAALQQRSATRLPNLQRAPLSEPVLQSSTTPDLIPSIVASSREPHSVSTIAQRRSVLKWMVDEVYKHREKKLAPKAIRKFSHLFTGSYKVNHAKAVHWWNNKENLMELSESGRCLGHLSGVTHHVLKRLNFKEMSGRGRKKAAWVVALYSALRIEFDRMHALNFKLSPSFLACAAKYLIHNADRDSLFASSNLIDGKPVVSKITIRWVQTFMDVQGLLIRLQAVSIAFSPEKQLFIEKTVAFHLGKLKRGFESSDLNEGLVENADETYFIFNMDNGRTVGFRVHEKVKYSDVLSGDEGITMMVRISGGVQARIQPPMLVFQNTDASYPIRGVEENVPGVCYRSGTKGWMDNRVFQAWLSEPRAIKKGTFGRKRRLYVDNCSPLIRS